MFKLVRIAFVSIVVAFGLAQLIGHGASGGPLDRPDASTVQRQSTNPWASDAPEPGRYADPGAPVSIQRDGSGQFHVDAQVNGTEARFLIDTGADVLALSEGEALRLGIPVDPGDFQPVVQTASGQAYGARIEIERLTIGGTDLGRVSAVVIRGLSTNLLGQSVLRRMGKVEMSGDSMTIHPG